VQGGCSQFAFPLSTDGSWTLEARAREQCCFSIVSDGKRKRLDLEAADAGTAAAWVTGLQYLLGPVQRVADKKRRGTYGLPANLPTDPSSMLELVGWRAGPDAAGHRRRQKGCGGCGGVCRCTPALGSCRQACLRPRP
jgi:hypothetical protein